MGRSRSTPRPLWCLLRLVLPISSPASGRSTPRARSFRRGLGAEIPVHLSDRIHPDETKNKKADHQASRDREEESSGGSTCARTSASCNATPTWARTCRRARVPTALTREGGASAPRPSHLLLALTVPYLFVSCAPGQGRAHEGDGDGAPTRPSPRRRRPSTSRRSTRSSRSWYAGHSLMHAPNNTEPPRLRAADRLLRVLAVCVPAG